MQNTGPTIRTDIDASRSGDVWIACVSILHQWTRTFLRITFVKADSVVCVLETVPDTGGGDIAPEAERQAGSDEHGRLDSGASDRTASEVPAILTARLLALRSPSGPTPASTTSASGSASIKKKQPNKTLSAKYAFRSIAFNLRSTLTHSTQKFILDRLLRGERPHLER